MPFIRPQRLQRRSICIIIITFVSFAVMGAISGMTYIGKQVYFLLPEIDTNSFIVPPVPSLAVSRQYTSMKTQRAILFNLMLMIALPAASYWAGG